jgi:hypothetical protein
MDSLNEAEHFLGATIPEEFAAVIAGTTVSQMVNAEGIKQAIAFGDPFLRTDRLVLFKRGDNGAIPTLSIGVGKVYREDMLGHYNTTVYLAFAGRLMPSTASIHLALVCPNTSPQAVEGKSIRMAKGAFNNGLIQPAEQGTTFYVLTEITRMKLSLVFANTRIYFGAANFGMIDTLKFVLTPRDSILNAVVPPEILQRV